MILRIVFIEYRSTVFIISAISSMGLRITTSLTECPLDLTNFIKFDYKMNIEARISI